MIFTKLWRNPKWRTADQKIMKIMNSSQYTTVRNSFSSKTTMRYRLTPVRMGFTKKSEESMKGILLHCRREYKRWCSHSGKRYADFLKHKIELPYDPEIPLLGILQKGWKLLIRKAMCTRGAQALKAWARLASRLKKKLRRTDISMDQGHLTCLKQGPGGHPLCAAGAGTRQSPLPGAGEDFTG